LPRDHLAEREPPVKLSRFPEEEEKTEEEGGKEEKGRPGREAKRLPKSNPVAGYATSDEMDGPLPGLSVPLVGRN